MGFLLSSQFWATASVVATIIASVLVPWLSDRSKKKREQADIDARADREWFEGRREFSQRTTEKVIIDRSGFKKGWDRGVESEQTDTIGNFDDRTKPGS